MEIPSYYYQPPEGYFFTGARFLNSKNPQFLVNNLAKKITKNPRVIVTYRSKEKCLAFERGILKVQFGPVMFET